MQYSNTAQGLASLGRNGDSMLMHVNPQEVAGLQRLASVNGTQLTINPKTGMPEAFNLGGFLPMIAGGALTALSGGALSPLMTGLLVGGATTLIEGDIGAGLMAGLGAGGGSSLFNSFSQLGASAAPSVATSEITGDVIAQDIATKAGGGTMGFGAESVAPQGMFSAGNNLGVSNPITAGLNPTTNTSGMFSNNLGANQAITGGTPPTTAPTVDTSMMNNSLIRNPKPDFMTTAANNFSEGTSQAGRGVKDFFSEGGVDRAKDILGRDNVVVGPDGTPYTNRVPLDNMDLALKMGTPIAGGIMSGLEESDIYGDPINMEQFEDNRFRGPQGQLNLAGVTNLNLNDPFASTGGGRFGIGLRGLLGNEGGAVRKYEEGGGVTGISSSPGLPIAGASSGITGGPGMEAVDSISGGSISTPAGTETFESMVASGVHPANAAATLGMDPTPYLDTGPGMEFTGTPRTAPVRSGIGTLPPPPVPFTPDPSFDDDYRGGYMTPFRKREIGLGTGGYDFTGPSPMRRPRESSLLASGGYLGGGDITVQGDGMSDDIPANIDGEQPAALSEGEFVIPADVVSHIGNGSSEAGAEEFYSMMDRVRMARTGRKKQAPEIDPEGFMPA